MKYTAPEMEMKELEVEDILMTGENSGENSGENKGEFDDDNF